MANEFPQLSDVFALDKQVTYKEAIEQVWLPQDNAILSVPSASPIETLTLSGYTITPTVALGAITYESGTTAELHFIDYSNLRDGAIIQIRIFDNTYPITIKNGITGNGGIFTNNGEDILLSDYRKIVQLQREGSIWRQVGTIQSANLPITNCITEIPQDIKLELNDGTLTLKAGSKVYVPNGFEADGVTPKFDEVVIESDITRSSFGSSSNQCFVMMQYSNGKITSFSYAYSNVTSSGTTPPVSGNFYNTSTNYLNSYNASAVVDQRAFPIGLMTLNAGVPVSIDQVFNGFGYIGNTVFALPGVKGLIPNGRNEDGSLKNIEFTVDRVRPQTFTSADNFSEVTYWLTSTGEFGGANVNINYHSNINKVLYDVDGTSRAYCNAGGFAVVSGKITSFSPKLPFRAVDYNDMHLKQDKATAVNYDNITNCITEIPQDIKLELNDGVLTLKAGSKVYVPNGVGNFTTVTITSDKTVTDTKTRTLWIGVTLGGSIFQCVGSETGSPVAGTYKYYYDNSENKCYQSAASSYHQASFPICICSATSGSGITSIDQVFNGFGYMGSTVFALPGVKGLAPNGRNADGSLKNTEVVCEGVSVYSTSAANTFLVYIKPNVAVRFAGRDSHFEQNEKPTVSTTYATWYSPEENRFRYTNDRGVTWTDTIGYVHCLTITTTTGGVITSFSPKTTFHAVDYNDVALKQNFQVVSTLPSSPNADTFYFIPE